MKHMTLRVWGLPVAVGLFSLLAIMFTIFLTYAAKTMLELTLSK